MTAQSALAAELNPQVQSASDLRIVIVGHVDHGKSTLVGRLLYDTNALPDGKYEQIKASCDKRGMPFEWSFLMDALQAERDQNVTIDTTQIWFSSTKRRYCLIDAPGHREFLKNMITGAASAEAALLLIDAQEGVKEQSKRHGYLLHMLGIKQVGVVVNKMDLVGYSQEAYDKIVSEYSAYLKEMGIEAAAFVPISAREGESIASRSDALAWYEGPTVLELLDQFESLQEATAQPLRFMVQDIYRFDARRIIAGRIESGEMKVGDKLVFSPSNLSASIKSFEMWPEGQSKTSAKAGESVGFTLDEQIFVERGQIASLEDNMPVVANEFNARIFWLHQRDVEIGKRYRLKLGTAEYKAELTKIVKVLDTDSLKQHESDVVSRHQVAEVTFRIRGLIALDDPNLLPKTGRFVLFDEYDVAGGGIIVADDIKDLRELTQKQVKSSHITTEDYEITQDERALINGHKGGVLWFTGLSGSGKSTLARELQKSLFAKGYQVYVLDGDNVRKGLCSDLGFSPEDRTENIRRIGEVAALFADAGFIVITAFISPYKDDRQRARATAPQHYNTIYIKASVDECEKRDVKGLYQKAKAGEIKEFTGISAPYEEPEHPDLVVDTEKLSIEESVDALLGYVKRNFDS